MRVAILHFHLRAGGVTRVIEMACEALVGQGLDPLVIVGEPPPANCRIPGERIAVVPDLRYGMSSSRAEQLFATVEAAMRSRWQDRADVIHVHNHSLGKNFALPLAISRWALEGRHLLLQIHDFAENGRPANYGRLLAQLGGTGGLSRCLYPVGPHILYAALNSRDRRRLSESGISECELLPNPVSLPVGGNPVDRVSLHADRLTVYPTRAIRRKNIGEALLRAALSPAGEKVILTAAPESGPDRQGYDQWGLFARSAAIPVVFDAQSLLRRPAIDFLLGADICLTTSVAEGFGMAFLEPWLAGVGLVGRDLPGVTRDFRSAGVTLDGLYDRLEIPADWVDLAHVKSSTERIIRASCNSYHIAFHEEYLRHAMESVHREGTVDFGRLEESLQREVLDGLSSHRFPRDGVQEQLPVSSREAISVNARIIEERFSLPAYGANLLRIYQTLRDQTAQTPGYLDAHRLLMSGMRFDDFFALRS